MFRTFSTRLKGLPIFTPWTLVGGTRGWGNTGTRFLEVQIRRVSGRWWPCRQVPRVNKERESTDVSASGTRLSTPPTIAPLKPKGPLAVANTTKPPMGSQPPRLSYTTANTPYTESCGQQREGTVGTWARWDLPLPPPLLCRSSNGAGIKLQAEVTALRTCLVSGPRQVPACILLHHTTARLRGVGAPSTLASGQKNEQFKGTDMGKKRGVRVTKDGAALDPYSIPPPTFLCSLARQRRSHHSTRFKCTLRGRRSKCVPVVTPPHPHAQLPPYEIRLIAKPSAYKLSPSPRSWFSVLLSHTSQQHQHHIHTKPSKPSDSIRPPLPFNK